MKKIFLTGVLFLLSIVVSRAQLSGVYNVPSTYTSVADAITALNSQGVSSSVTIEITAGYTETVTAGGFTLNAITGASSTNRIVFMKTGVGANPILYAYSGGTNTPATAEQDGVFRLVGADFITIDGIDITDPNTSNPATMEFGYGLFKANAGNGCQNNIIQNCVITLQTVNSVAGAGPSLEGSRGINMINATPSANTTAITPTVAAGANSNNKFYANTILNCHIGICLIGFADATPFTFADRNNDVGGNSIATGNNIINFGGGGTTASAGVSTLAQYTLNVSYNTVNSNNGSGANHAGILRGIFLNTATSAGATVNNNTVTVKAAGTTQVVSAIQNASGSTAASNTIAINNNLIVNCSYTTASSGDFSGILNSGTAAALIVTGNTFSNNVMKSTTGFYYNINNTGAVTVNLNFSNNLFTGIVYHPTSGVLRGISSTGGGASSTITIAGNTLTPVSSTVTGTGIHSFIFNSPTTARNNITLNTAVNVTFATTGNAFFINNSNSANTSSVSGNFVTGSFAKAGAGGIVYGYYNFGSPTGGTTTINGNNFSNCNVTGATTFYGIYQGTGTSQVEVVSNNMISNTTGGTDPVYGVYHSYGATGSAVSGNTVTGLSCAGIVYGISIGNTASTQMNVNNNLIYALSNSGGNALYGIHQAGGTTTNIFANRIYDLSSGNIAGTVRGIFIVAGTTTGIFNNLIGDLKTPAAESSNAISGIYLSGGTGIGVYYNSIHLSATSSGSVFGTNALYASTTPAIDVRNNIFSNVSVPTGTGLTVAYMRSSTTLSTYSATSNNNLFYASVPSASTVIFTDGTNTYSTLALYKALVATRDGNSVTELPPFLSLSGSNANFLKIDPAIATQVESGGTPVTGITTDYAGTVRNTTTPDIGAWEGNYILLDLVPPSITYAALTSTCGLSDRSFTVAITDVIGIPVSGSLTPTLYFKKNSGSYVSAPGTLVSGTANNSVWSFTVSGAALSGVTAGDVIRYFVVAQDIASTPNIGANPSVGFTGTDVNNVTTAPTAPNAYTLTGLLSGLYTVGSGGNFVTLSAAAVAYNTSCLSGPVTFQLTDASYSTAETFPIVFANNPNASSTFSLLVTPGSAVNASVIGTSTAAAVIKFLDARFITFDGVNSGRSLTINSTNSSTAAAIWLASSTTAGGGNNSIGLNRMFINGGSNTLAGNYGIVACVDGTIVSTTGGQDNDNITIQQNSILRTYRAIYGTGTASVSVGGLDNWNVSGNLIGPASNGTNNIGGLGVFMRNAVNVIISGNTIRNIQTTATTTIGGINLSAFVNSVTVAQNTITSVRSSAASSGLNAINGMLIGASVTNATVNANSITGIENTNASGYGARGIIVNTTSNSAVSIQNNMISDIVSYTDASAIFWPIGIALEGSSGGVNVDYNSINLFGGHTGLGNANSSTPLYFNTTGVCTIRNNIFANTYDNTSSTTDVNYAIYSTGTASNFAVMNYNNYYAAGTGSAALGYQASGLTSLAQLQTAFGGNVNSTTIAPQFVSNTDLHLKPTIGNELLHNSALSIATVTNDIDSQVRSGTPDIGADEFTIPTCTAASGGVLSSASGTACAGQVLTVSSGAVSDGLTTTYQWQVATTAGGPYGNVSGGTGATTPSYTSAVLPTGVYYVVLKATCGTLSISALSNEGTLTVNSVPTSSATVSTPTLCSGTTLSLTGISGGATTFTWSGPGGFTSNSQNPTISNISTTGSGTYFFTAKAAGCTSTVAAVSVTVRSVPGAITITPASPIVCLGTAATLAAVGGSAPAVMNFTPQTNQNSTTTYPAPYSVYYGGQKMQFLVLASELTSSGLTAGPLTSIQFPVVSLGSNWGGSLKDLQGFQVSIGATNLTSVGATFQTGLTVVASSTNFTPTVGYANTHIFNSPFTWDGVSNIIVETVFSNNISGTTSDAVIQYNSATSFQSTMVYRADVSTFATIAAATTTNVATTLVRPDFKLTGTGSAPFTWSPSGGLSGTSGPTVAASPGSTTIYTVTATNQGCSSKQTTTVNLVSTPTLSIVATKTAVCIGDTLLLTASGAPSFTWNNQSTSATIIQGPGVNTTYTVYGELAPCPVVSQTIGIIVKPLPVVSAVSSSSAICKGGTATLTASGAVTYSWNTGAATVNATVSPVVNTIYTVTGTDATGCSAKVAVSVISNSLPVVTAASSSPSVCAGKSATLTAGGAGTYLWSSGNSTSSFVYTPATNTVLNVVGTLPTGCSSSASVALTVKALPVIVAASQNETICPQQTATLSVSGANTYTWSPGDVSPSAFSSSVIANPAVTTVYSVTGHDGSCANTVLINVFVGQYPVLSFAASAPSVCANAPATLTGSGALTYTWLPGNVVSQSVTVNPTATTIYTLNGSNGGSCNASKTFVLKVDPCTGVSELQSLSQFIRVYPNPTNGMIKADFSFEGNKDVTITNSIGEVISVEQSSSDVYETNLSSYAKGIYFVRITAGNSTATYKVILQ